MNHTMQIEGVNCFCLHFGLFAFDILFWFKKILNSKWKIKKTHCILISGCLLNCQMVEEENENGWLLNNMQNKFLSWKNFASVKGIVNVHKFTDLCFMLDWVKYLRCLKYWATLFYLKSMILVNEVKVLVLCFLRLWGFLWK